LQADADSRAAAVARLRQQLDASQQEAAGRAAAAAAAESANAGLTRQLAELREQLKSAVQQVCVFVGWEGGGARTAWLFEDACLF